MAFSDYVIPARNMSEVRFLNAEAGFHFFDKSTMRFFKSRVESALSKRNLFITSEQAQGCARRYTVRQYIPSTGDIKTVFGFQRFPDKSSASYAMRYQALPYPDTSNLGLPSLHAGGTVDNGHFNATPRCR